MLLFALASPASADQLVLGCTFNAFGSADQLRFTLVFNQATPNVVTVVGNNGSAEAATIRTADVLTVIETTRLGVSLMTISILSGQVSEATLTRHMVIGSRSVRSMFTGSCPVQR